VKPWFQIPGLPKQQQQTPNELDLDTITWDNDLETLLSEIASFRVRYKEWLYF
jgi:hypothetical protein